MKQRTTPLAGCTANRYFELAAEGLIAPDERVFPAGNGLKSGGATAPPLCAAGRSARPRYRDRGDAGRVLRALRPAGAFGSSIATRPSA